MKVSLIGKVSLILFSPFVIALAMISWEYLETQANSQFPAIGILDDRGVHVPANYTNWTPPAVGVSFTDSAFGSLMTRLSNGPAQFNDAVHHEYATMSPFNKGNTRILLLTENSGFYVADLRGNVIVTPDQFPVNSSSEPRWSVTDSEVLYFHEPRGNQIKKYDLRTHQSSVVY